MYKLNLFLFYRLLLVGFLLHTCTYLNSQTFTVEYVARHNLKKPPSQNGKNTLVFNRTKSIYTFDDFPKESEYRGSENMPVFVKGDPEGLPIYMNFITHKMIYKSEYGHPKVNYIWTDTIPNIQWDIINESKTIEGQKLWKATCDYAGRAYVAWYSLDIPVPFGPYKFTGLPGLIFEIHSNDENVNFELVSITENNTIQEINPPDIGVKIDSITYISFLRKKLQRAETFGATNNDPPSDWDIELNKHTNYKKIKALRGYD